MRKKLKKVTKRRIKNFKGSAISLIQTLKKIETIAKNFEKIR